MTHKLASFNIFETAHRHPGMPFQGAMLGAVPLDLKVGFIIQSAIFCRSTYIGATVLHQKPKQSFFGYLAFNTTSNLVCLTPLYTKSACVAHIHNCFDFFQSTLPEQSSSLWHLLNKTVPCPEKSVHAASALFTICLRSHWKNGIKLISGQLDLSLLTQRLDILLYAQLRRMLRWNWLKNPNERLQFKIQRSIGLNIYKTRLFNHNLVGCGQNKTFPTCRGGWVVDS